MGGYGLAMAKTTKDVTVSLRTQTLKALDAAARKDRRSRSAFVDLTLERALSGSQRQAEPQAFADSEGKGK
jgi:metal-responsive CopG/Arc/MetJ family transcriptional regulator